MGDRIFTQEEIENMRDTVIQHDMRETNKEFDLNKPPVKSYKYQEFPRLMYNHAVDSCQEACSQEEMDEMIEAGWSTSPGSVVTAAWPKEVEQPDQDDTKPRRGRRR